ncbi:hypothetical protein C3941_19430 [Kaistia algarum]|uniref:DUF2165 family protein n=1 Tax=Kaistia algarum TaxID=2083279 RepID=UPI000CE87C4D|nr:DUF2165 family protein [Kaistia algarum]MCX5516165.1 DUF2165 family protein [Kaistia algarum]PPE78240.1 hypothetical protein C3941_19430 [Kaistia algarum]
MEHMTLWVEALLVAAQTGWLALGAIENVRVPRANRDMVADVIAMRQLRAEFPDMFKLVGSHRIESPAFHRLAFAAIVIAECIVAAVMAAGTLALIGAALGLLETETAKVIATLGVLGFTMIWSAFLVGGQWFHYFAGHQSAQHTHFLLAIWGTVVLCLLVGL